MCGYCTSAGSNFLENNKTLTQNKYNQQIACQLNRHVMNGAQKKKSPKLLALVSQVNSLWASATCGRTEAERFAGIREFISLPLTR